MNINLRWQFHIILNRIPIVSTDLAFRFFHWSLSKIAPNVEKAWWQPPDNSMQFSFTILCLQIPWHLTVQPIKRHDPFPILFFSAFGWFFFWHFSSVSQVRTKIGPQLRACCVSSSCAFTSISCFPQPLQGDCVCSAPAGRLLPAGLALQSAGALVGVPLPSPPSPPSRGSNASRQHRRIRRLRPVRLLWEDSGAHEWWAIGHNLYL